jgi:pyruvate/2-oxoglutarate/acetoin dehydrogenase E1 component
MLISAIRDNNPVIFIEHFKLYADTGDVPLKSYLIPFGKAVVRKKGNDVTLVGISYMNIECLTTAHYLEGLGVSAEVIDPVSLVPLDIDTIIRSVNKTGRLIVADVAWTSCGVSAEIVARIAEYFGNRKHIQVERIGFAPVPSPNTPSLEKHFYPNAESIAKAVLKMTRSKSKNISSLLRKKDKPGMTEKI